MGLGFPAAAMVCDLAIVGNRLAPIAVRREDGEPLDETALVGTTEPGPLRPNWTAISASRATSVDGEPLRLLTELQDRREESRQGSVTGLLRAAIVNGRLTPTAEGLRVEALYCGALVRLDLVPTAENPRRLYVKRVSRPDGADGHPS